MSSYIHFTEEQKQRAAAVDLEEFLRCRGEKLLSSGREKRLASDHSVTVRGNEWYDHAEERGGHAVSFVQRFYSLSYPDAVTMLLGGELGTAYPSAGERTEEPVKPFALPPANKDMRRVFAYLIKHRGIAKDVVAHFAKAGLLYEDAEYHNAVFVGTDAEGVPRHAHKRSANSYGKAFRLNVEGSDPRYSFHHVGTDRSLYVFEAPIDMLSYIRFIRRTGSGTAMWPAAGHPFSRYCRCWNKRRSSIPFCSVLITMKLAIRPAAGCESSWRRVIPWSA